MSEFRVILCIALLIFAAGCGVGSALANAEMQGKVNQCLPKAEQLEAPWGIGKRRRLFRTHRSLFPHSWLRMVYGVAGFLMIGSLVTIAVLAGIL